MLRQRQKNQEISARSAVESGRLRELLIYQTMIAKADRLTLDDQDAARLERPRPRLAVPLARALPRGVVGGVPHALVQLGGQAQGGVQPLARAAERGRFLGHDLLLGPLERFLSLVHTSRKLTPDPRRCPPR